MFGFTLTRTKKTPKPLQVAVPVIRENVKLNNGNTFINAKHLVDAFTGKRGLNMPVGKEVIDGKWYTLFLRTKNGSIAIDKHGEAILNRR